MFVIELLTQNFRSTAVTVTLICYFTLQPASGLLILAESWTLICISHTCRLFQTGFSTLYVICFSWNEVGDILSSTISVVLDTLAHLHIGDRVVVWSFLWYLQMGDVAVSVDILILP